MEAIVSNNSNKLLRPVLPISLGRGDRSKFGNSKQGLDLDIGS